MNEKMVNIMLFLVFIMIGINGFLLYTTQLQMENGSSFSEFFGLSSGGLSYGTINDSAEGITFDTTSTEGLSSTDPSTEQGLVTPQNAQNEPAALTPLDYVNVAVNGVEIVMDKFSDMFPFLYPITFAVKAFTALLKILFLAFIALNIRSFLGRRI